jgi:Lrp/AsnC family transcriptional regulator
MKQAVQLDPIDRRIVEQLQADASLGSALLAERVGASSASVWRRIKSLEAAGVLGATVRLVDPRTIGRGVTVLCNVRMRSHDSGPCEEFERYVAACPEIIECFSMSGDWDYLLRIVVADVDDYNAFLMKRLLRQPNVGGASSHFALAVTKYTTALPI